MVKHIIDANGFILCVRKVPEHLDLYFEWMEISIHLTNLLGWFFFGGWWGGDKNVSPNFETGGVN